MMRTVVDRANNISIEEPVRQPGSRGVQKVDDVFVDRNRDDLFSKPPPALRRGGRHLRTDLINTFSGKKATETDAGSRGWAGEARDRGGRRT